jgi:two-component system response regulator MprA
LDPAAHALRYGDTEVLVSPTEFRILAAITSRPGEVVRRRAVVAAAWPDGAVVSENTIDSYIRRVRAKLDQLGAPVTLQTVRGVGFVLR